MTRQRLLMIGVLAALAGLYVLISGPVAARQAGLREALAEEHEKLLDYERFVKNSSDASEYLEGLHKEIGELESYLVSETDSTPAFARLQIEIQDLAGSAGLAVTSIRPLDTAEFHGYRELSIQVEARGSIIQVGAFLRKLDSLRMFVGMEELELTFTEGGELRMRSIMKGLAGTQGEAS